MSKLSTLNFQSKTEVFPLKEILCPKCGSKTIERSIYGYDVYICTQCKFYTKK